MNINVGIHYLGAWLAGNGCVPIHNLMEDAATAEISRSQVWQWIRTPKGVLEDGRRITADMVRQFVPEELAKIKAGGFVGKFDRAAEIFTQMSTQDEFAEFLTCRSTRRSERARRRPTAVAAEANRGRRYRGGCRLRPQALSGRA